MSSGTLVNWNVKVGQPVAPGDVLAEVETDKATLAWENQDDGFVAKLLVADGTEGVEVGRGVCVLCEEEEDVEKFGDYVVADGAGVAEGPSARDSGADGAVAAGIRRVSPAARIVMEANGLDLGRVVGTGPKGVVTKEDALMAVARGLGGGARDVSSGARDVSSGARGSLREGAMQQAPVQAPAQDQTDGVYSEGVEYTDIPTTNMRKVIARRLLESKTTVPHMYASIDIVLDNVLAMRKTLAESGIRVSLNDCVLRAVALALEQVPAANAYWDEKEQVITPSPAVDVCVAVATEGGLFTPIVKDANHKSLREISADVRRLAGKAKENKLMPEEYVGGSFSVSNLGMFGVERFSAIVNPPQGGILAVGGDREVARVVDGSLEKVTEMTVTLSADGRVYDGETAGAFLEAVKRNMEESVRLSIV